jgi:hypothetical protein
LTVESARGGQIDLSLYWQLPAASDGRSIAIAGRARARMQSSLPRELIGDFDLPGVAVRRSEELIVTHVRLPDTSQSSAGRIFEVSLQDADGRPVRTVGGADALDVPLGLAPR